MKYETSARRSCFGLPRPRVRELMLTPSVVPVSIQPVAARSGRAGGEWMCAKLAGAMQPIFRQAKLTALESRLLRIAHQFQDLVPQLATTNLSHCISRQRFHKYDSHRLLVAD